MIEFLRNKFRQWLAQPLTALSADQLLAQFIAELAQAGYQLDYRELADLLWLEQWISTAKATQTRQAGPKKRKESPPTPPTGETKPPLPHATKTSASITAYTPAGASAAAEAIRATRVRLHGAAALPNTAMLNRALRPLSRRTKSPLAQMFDEEATAEASAESGFIKPVFRPAPERWFSVALVLEDAPSMVVWQQTARELFDLLAQSGSFRSVQQFRLQYVAPRFQLVTASGAIRQPQSLCHSSARQLIILLSDGASERWSDGTMAEVLTTWGKTCAVVIAQMLSQRMWPRTPLGWPEAEIKAVQPGSPNAALQLDSWWRSWDSEPVTPVPIIGLHPDTIGRWAHMLMHPGARYRAALFAPPTSEQSAAGAVTEPARQFAGAAERLAHFKALVSPEAYHLAIYLSLLPVTLPVMRLVQTALLRNPWQEQLAELLVGGILYRVPLTKPDLPPSDLPADEVEYDFYEGVREVLEQRIYTDEVGTLLHLIGEQVSTHTAGKYDITALLPDEQGELTLPANVRPFARFLVPALRRLGLSYLIGVSGAAEIEEEGDELSATASVTSAKPTIFLSYAHEDYEIVKSLYRDLQEAGYEPWLDKVDLPQGADFIEAIPKVMRESDLLIIGLSSRAVGKERFIQKEIQLAYDLWEKQGNDDLLFFPVRLDDCPVPELISNFFRVDLFGDRAGEEWENLLRLLEDSARKLGKRPQPAEVETALPEEQVARILTLARAGEVEQAFEEARSISPPREAVAALCELALYFAETGDRERVQEAIKTAEAVQRRLATRKRIDQPALREMKQQIQATKTKAEELLAAKNLTEFTFTTVTLDRRGKELERKSLTARQFVEELAPDLKVNTEDAAPDREKGMLPQTAKEEQQMMRKLYMQSVLKQAEAPIGEVKGKKDKGISIPLEMVAIPGGTFTMGSSAEHIEEAFAEYKRYYKEAQREWFTSEQPPHKVTVAPFYLGKFTITQEQWRVIAADTSLKVARDLEPEPASFKDKPDSARRPVERVSWEEAQEFCARLAKKTGRAYRLPTEAEWEYACRAGTTTPFAFGGTITSEIVNYNGEYPYAEAPKGKDRSETIPVGSLGVANAFGIFDMHGNVWEWCEDVWHENYKDAPDDGTAWTSGGNSNRRILRGGGWGLACNVCRSAGRDPHAPGARNYLVGFRVVVAARTK